MPRDASKIWEKHQQRLRDAAVRAALPLLDSASFDEAERSVLAADSSIIGSVAVARMYEQHLRKLLERGTHRKSPELVEEVFRRALKWAHASYPEPHTQMEAEGFERGRAEDSARLAALMGGDYSDA